MKRNLKSRRRSPKEQVKEQVKERVFTSVDEFSSYFFPKGRAEKEVTKGKERGTREAENAFTEIAKNLQL